MNFKEVVYPYIYHKLYEYAKKEKIDALAIELENCKPYDGRDKYDKYIN